MSGVCIYCICYFAIYICDIVIRARVFGKTPTDRTPPKASCASSATLHTLLSGASWNPYAYHVRLRRALHLEGPWLCVHGLILVA